MDVVNTLLMNHVNLYVNFSTICVSLIVDFLTLTIFIDWSIIVIASGDERSASSSAKVSPSMVLTWEKILKELRMWYHFHWSTKLYETISIARYHIIINERTTILNESCNRIGQVFNWPIRNWASKLSEPWIFHEWEACQF